MRGHIVLKLLASIRMPKNSINFGCKVISPEILYLLSESCKGMFTVSYPSAYAYNLSLSNSNINRIALFVWRPQISRIGVLSGKELALM